MHKLDKLKGILGLILVAAVILSFVILGKDHTVTRWLAAISIVIWMIMMFWVNRMKKKS